MTLLATAQDIRTELATAIKSGRIPAKIAPGARKLVDRLARPVMIGIGGLPGSGKSTLLNLLAGSQVLSNDVRLPTTELSYGESPAAICTLPDGSKTEFDHADVGKIADLSPIFVQIKLPLPALTRVSLLELVASDDEVELHRALLWMSKRSDIAIWCTQVFTSAEQSLWTDMPDGIRDHAFLLFTKADLLKSGSGLSESLEAARSDRSALFTHILPIETVKAIAARRPDGSVDREKMRDSGGVALVSAILRTVDMGLQAAIDRAELLLRQADMAATPAAKEPTAAAPKEVVPSAPAVKAAVEEPKETADVAKEKPRPAETATPPVPQPTTEPQPDSKEIYEKAVDYLAHQGEELGVEIAEEDSGAPARVMAKAVENVQWLSDLLEEADISDPALAQAYETALDATDLVQLMQMENRDSASIEAVSLMIQLKRELQLELAA